MGYTNKDAPKKVAVEGDTYPVRKYLYSLGGHFDRHQKVWMVPEEKAKDAERAVNNPHLYGDSVSMNERNGL